VRCYVSVGCEVCRNSPLSTAQSTIISVRNVISTAEQTSSRTAPPLLPSGAGFSRHRAGHVRQTETGWRLSDSTAISHLLTEIPSIYLNCVLVLVFGFVHLLAPSRVFQEVERGLSNASNAARLSESFSPLPFLVPRLCGQLLVRARVRIASGVDDECQQGFDLRFGSGRLSRRSPCLCGPSEALAPRICECRAQAVAQCRCGCHACAVRWVLIVRSFLPNERMRYGTGMQRQRMPGRPLAGVCQPVRRKKVWRAQSMRWRA